MPDSSPITCYIALGANLGDRAQNIRDAIDLLNATPGIRVLAMSKNYENPAQGMGDNAPPFLNAAARLETTLSPQALLARLLEIEKQMGRQRRVGWEPRIIDLDLLLFEDQVISSENLTVPHPRMHERRFVLAPLAEIAAEVSHPTLGKSIRELSARAPK